MPRLLGIVLNVAFVAFVALIVAPRLWRLIGRLLDLLPEKIREKIPFLRDAFLRELNKGSIVKADDPKTVDVAAVKTRLETRMKLILPAGTVTALKLAPIVVTPLQAVN